MRSSWVVVEEAVGLPAGLDDLVVASLSEGFGAVERLRDAWLDGSNRFDAPGEVLLAARVDRSSWACAASIEIRMSRKSASVGFATCMSIRGRDAAVLRPRS